MPGDNNSNELAFVCQQPPYKEDPCLPGWKFDVHSFKCFIVKTTRANFANAIKGCSTYGSDVRLASVHNVATNALLSYLAKDEKVWLGGSKTKSRNFEWLDGSDWDYDKW